MKKIITVMAALSAAFMLASCASKGIEGKGVKLAAGRPEIIDYKGQAFGSDIPGWVIDAADGETKEVQKALKLKGQKVWILQNDGTDLDMLKLWTDQIDGRSQIASAIEQTVGDLISAELDASQENTSAADKAMYVNEFSTRMTNLTLQGLDKVTDYWTKTRTLKTGVKKAKSDADYTYKYTYLVVFAMDEDMFETQVQAAFADIDDNDEQSAMLRDIVTSKLKERVDIFAAK